MRPNLIQTIEQVSTRDENRAKAPRISPESAARACSSLLGIEPVRIEYPGGAARCSVRAVGGKSTYIVTRRKSAPRAALEAGVLRELRAAGAPVPAVLAFDGEWLIQEDLGARRLSAAFGGGEVRFAGAWAARAAAALLLCQRAADKAALAQRVAPIGATSEWIAGMLSSPGRVAAQLRLPDPDIGASVTPEQMAPRRYSFVKWDARPGNALLVEGGADEAGVGWVDWEHCGARDALDDLAWLLCDEYMPDDAGLEDALLKRFLPLFALQSQRTAADALVYLSRFGSLHSCMRLSLVLKHKGQGAWWNPEACERTDRVGVTAQGAQRLCTRGARWSRRWPGGERLSEFFFDAGKRLRAASVEVDSSAVPMSPVLHRRNVPAAASVPCKEKEI